jgi:hypothetical protein
MRNYPFVEPTFQPRHTQLAICQSIYDANAFNTQNWIHGFETDPEMLPDSVTKFLRLMDELDVEFCIVGGIAYLAYIQDRNTKDLDILISVKELNKIIGYVEVVSEDANFTNTLFEGLKIDFLKTSNRLFEYVQRNEVTTYEFAEGTFPVATINGLILMRFDSIIDLYQKGKFTKALYYERDLQVLTVGFDIDWNQIWSVSKNFFTDGQIDEFKKMISDWQKPRRNRFGES